MSKKETKKNEEIVTSSFNLISQGTEIKGDIVCRGDIRMDGTIKGNIDSKAKVVIGASGAVEGTIVCQNADISGAIAGGIEVAESLYLKATATLNGEITTGKLIVEAGAIFNGNCRMGGFPEKAPVGKGRARDKVILPDSIEQ